MGMHHTPSKRALAVLTTIATLGFSGILPPGIAGADPAPKAGDPCVPVRIISADGTWAKGDKQYLQEIIAKAKAEAGGNLASSTLQVEMREPETVNAENPLADGDYMANALTRDKIRFVSKFAAYTPSTTDYNDTERYRRTDAKIAELGTETPVGAVYSIGVSMLDDAGVKSLLDDGWIPRTDAVLKAAALSSPDSYVYRQIIKFAPVGVVGSNKNGSEFYFKNEADRAGFRSFVEDNKAMAELVLGRKDIKFPEKLIGSPKDWESLDGQGGSKTDGKSLLNDIRQKALEGTLESFEGQGGPIVEAAKTAKDASSSSDRSNLPAVTLPAAPQVPDLPVVPEIFAAADQPADSTPTVTPNTPEQTPAPGKPSGDTELDGVPGGSGGAPTTGGEPTVTTNQEAPTPTTTEAPTSVVSDGTSTTSPSDESSTLASSTTSESSPTSSAPPEDRPDPKYTPANNKVTGDKKYDADKAALKRKLAAQMQMVSKECPSTRFVLLGAREGAGAIGDLAADIGNGNGPVAPEKVIAVGLLSDPERNPMPGLENTVSDLNKTCVVDSADSGTPTATTQTVANKGGGGETTPSTSATTTAENAPKRTLGQPCSQTNQSGGPLSGGQLIGETVNGSGIYGQRTMGFGALSGRTATICLKSDAKCASSRENTLVPLLARALSGDQKATPAAMQAAMQSATGLLKLLAAIDFGQITSMSSDVQKVATNAPILGAAIGTMLVAPNPASAAVALNSAAPTAQGVLGIGGGVLKISARLVQVYESTPELPQIVDFINLINPDTKGGKELLAKIPGGNSPQTTAALRAVIPVLNALNSIPKGQVLSLGGDITQTLGKALTNPGELVTLLSQSVSLFSTVAGAATGLGNTPNAMDQTASLVNPYSVSDKSATQAVDYSSSEVNRGGTTATDWMGSWLGSQSDKAVSQLGTSGVGGDATFGGRPSYSGAPG